MAENQAGAELPPLAACMRNGRDGLGRAALLVWQEVNALGIRELLALSPEELEQMAQLAGPEDRERDEAYADLLRREEVAQALGVPGDLLDRSLAAEGALRQMEAAAAGLGLSAADCVRLLRAGLYASNGENEAAQAELSEAGDLPWQERRRLVISFADVLAQEGVLAQRAEKTRLLSEKQEAVIQEQMEHLGRSRAEREDIEALLTAVRDPARASFVLAGDEAAGRGGGR